jgi:hypothetical protein
MEERLLAETNRAIFRVHSRSPISALSMWSMTFSLCGMVSPMGIGFLRIISQTPMREGESDDVSHFEVLTEGLSFIVHMSLLKILGDGLLDHFTDAAAAEAYWAGHHLTLGGL